MQKIYFIFLKQKNINIENKVFSIINGIYRKNHKIILIISKNKKNKKTIINLILKEIKNKNSKLFIKKESSLIINTSGTTKTPRLTVLSFKSLFYSAKCSIKTLSNRKGQWLLALPINYIAGIQVIIRSVILNIFPQVINFNVSFSQKSFLYTFHKMTKSIKYTALVPTQLFRLLNKYNYYVIEALQKFHTILIGGDFISKDLTDKIKKYNIQVSTTYGCTESSGGCVYNHIPMKGINIIVNSLNQRICINGPILCRGYLNNKNLNKKSFQIINKKRFFITDDIGYKNRNSIYISKRINNIIKIGGIKHSINDIQEVLNKIFFIKESILIKINNLEWGEIIAALIVKTTKGRLSNSELSIIKKYIETKIGKLSIPKVLLSIDSIPKLCNNKIDKLKILQILKPYRKYEKKEFI